MRVVSLRAGTRLGSVAPGKVLQKLSLFTVGDTVRLGRALTEACLAEIEQVGGEGARAFTRRGREHASRLRSREAARRCLPGTTASEQKRNRSLHQGNDSDIS
jgi:hypothetical protein